MNTGNKVLKWLIFFFTQSSASWLVAELPLHRGPGPLAGAFYCGLFWIRRHASRNCQMTVKEISGSVECGKEAGNFEPALWGGK